jgi:hypothetical protein
LLSQILWCFQPRRPAQLLLREIPELWLPANAGSPDSKAGLHGQAVEMTLSV